MKTSKKVAVCYDGKYGRRVEGTIIKQHNGHHIDVEFIPYASDAVTPVVVRFRRGKNNRHWEGYHRHDVSLMESMMGLPGDYYAIKGRWIENWKFKSPIKLERLLWKFKHTS